MLSFGDENECMNMYANRTLGQPMIHIGPVAAGRHVSADPQLRQEFSSRYGVSAFNQADLAAVVESIYGNRKDQVNECHTV